MLRVLAKRSKSNWRNWCTLSWGAWGQHWPQLFAWAAFFFGWWWQWFVWWWWWWCKWTVSHCSSCHRSYLPCCHHPHCHPMDKLHLQQLQPPFLQQQQQPLVQQLPPSSSLPPPGIILGSPGTSVDTQSLESSMSLASASANNKTKIASWTCTSCVEQIWLQSHESCWRKTIILPQQAAQEQVRCGRDICNLRRGKQKRNWPSPNCKWEKNQQSTCSCLQKNKNKTTMAIGKTKTIVKKKQKRTISN